MGGKKKVVEQALRYLAGELSPEEAIRLSRTGVSPDQFRPYTSNWRGRQTSYYNPEYWRAVPDTMEDEAGKVIATREKIDPLVPRRWAEDVIKQDPELMYRGMSADELADILLRKQIQSRGEYNFDNQKGLTYFTSDPASAESYANGFAPADHRPNMERPAYIVAARRPPGDAVTSVGGVASHEIGVNRPTPLDDVVGLYRGKTTAFDPGVQDKGLYVAPTARLHWEEKSLDDILRGKAEGGRITKGGGGAVDDVLKWLSTILKTDNPVTRGQSGGEEWLASKIAAANEARDGRALRGPDTAWARDVMIPTDLLAKMPGAKGEIRGPGDAQYDRLLKRVQEEGWNPTGISVAINHRGEPYIYEGNTRAAVAKHLGIDAVPGDIHWMNGAETGSHDYTPEKLAPDLFRFKKGGGGFLDDALKIAGRAITGEAEDEIPAIAREGYKVTAHPDAGMQTKSFVDYLNTREHLPMDQASRMQRKADMGFDYDAYHGSPRDIESFANHLSNAQGWWGGHHYATTSPVDASENYATPLGADIMQRIGEKHEEVLNNFHPRDVEDWYFSKYGAQLPPSLATDSNIVKEYADDYAHEALGIENQGAVYPVSMRMKNPVRIESPDQTHWEHRFGVDENGDPMNEEGPAVDLINHTRDVLSEYDADPRMVDEALTKLWDAASDYGGVDAKTYNDIIRNTVQYVANPETGEMVSPGHVMSDVFQRMGHDGIIMSTDVFAPNRFRKGMAGTGGDTQHYIVFDPKNIRSRNAAFDPFKSDSTRLSDAMGGAVKNHYAEGGSVRDGYATKGSVIKKAMEIVGEDLLGGARRTPTEVFPDLATRYPEVIPPVPAVDKKTGKEYLAKALSPEALAVQKARKAIQGDIEAGAYNPFFDVAKRADVDPSFYPKSGTTVTDAMPVKQETRAKWRAKAFDPEGLQRLREGYEAGLKQKDVAENWYFMKQLEDEFIKELGPEEGRKQFKERFAKPMALTTGGADPTDNLMMAYYGNYMHNRGEAIPETNQMPFPIGGRYVGSNMDMFERNIGNELTTDNPKRMNLQNNFLGHKDATIDEQMSKGFDPKLQMPEWYGPYEEAINHLAAEYKVDPRYFQEVGWAGLKSKMPGGYKGKPMIQHVNEAIERTSRITGVPPEEVVRRGFVRGEMPIYGITLPIAGAAVGAGAASGTGEPLDSDPDVDGALRIAKADGGGFLKAVTKLLGPAERDGLAPLTRPGSGYVGIPGKPDTVDIPHIGKVEAKPIPGIMDSADAYMRARGLPGAHEISEFPDLDIEKARRIAAAFARMKHAPDDPAVRRAYEALADETMDQYRAAKDTGIDFTAIRGDDPYAKSPAIGYADIGERGHLSFFPTDAGFGSSIEFDPRQNPLLKRVGKIGDLDNATVNDAFRIVHDLYGHYGPGNPFFRGPGEERAFQLHKRMFSPDALPAMATETRGQNSWLNYGPHGEKNRTALGADTIFADQKTGLMPRWTYEGRAAGGRVGYEEGGAPQVFMTDAQGHQYDAQGNIVAPAQSAQASDSTAQDVPAARDTSHTAPANYYTDVQPLIDDATKPMDRMVASDNPNTSYFTGTDQMSDPDLVDVMRVAAQVAASGQPKEEEDTRGPANWSRRREEAVNKLYGDTPAAQNQAAINNTMLGMATYPVEALHDIPYEAVRTGDYGSAALEGGLNLALSGPGLAALGAVTKPAIDLAKRFPKVAAGVAGALGLTAGSDEAEAGPERWFSKLLEGAKALPMEKMSGEQALAMLRKVAPAEELRWTGTEGLLKARPSITKGELVDHIAKNRVNLNETTLGYGPKPTKREDVVIDPEIRAKYREQMDIKQRQLSAALLKISNGNTSEEIRAATIEVKRARNSLRMLEEAVIDAQIQKIGGLGKAAKYEGYSTPGGEQYKERLFSYSPDLMEHARSLVDPAAWERMTQAQREELAGHQANIFKSGHWSEPNVVAHVRSQVLDATPPGANRPYKAYNADEYQSDWGQAGRDKGFRDPDAMQKAAAIDAERQRIAQEWRDKINPLKEELERLREPILDEREAAFEDIAQRYKRGEITPSERERLRNEAYSISQDHLRPIMREHEDKIAAVVDPLQLRLHQLDEEKAKIKTHGITRGPYVGNTEHWTDLAIKKSIDDAIDSGAEYFTWSPGDVHADRYNLQNHIGSVEYNPYYGTLTAHDPGGDRVIRQDLSPYEEEHGAELASYVGNELAEKLLRQAKEKRAAFMGEYSITEEPGGGFAIRKNGQIGSGLFPNKTSAEDALVDLYASRLRENPIKLSGIDLKIGGEGMKKYYGELGDKPISGMVEKRVKKILKDATGEEPKIEVITVQTANGPRQQLGVRLDERHKNARFSDFNRGGVVRKKRDAGGQTLGIKPIQTPSLQVPKAMQIAQAAAPQIQAPVQVDPTATAQTAAPVAQAQQPQYAPQAPKGTPASQVNMITGTALPEGLYWSRNPDKKGGGFQAVASLLGGMVDGSLFKGAGGGGQDGGQMARGGSANNSADIALRLARGQLR